MQTEQAVTCKYPGCENEPRAADDGAGAKPKYCGRPDPLTGKPHTALTAFRRRQELTRQGGAAEAEDLGRPVTMATARAAELRNGIRADMTALTGKLTDLAAQLDRAADPEAAAAQVEAVQAEAAQQVADAQAETAREAQRRQQAEADAEEARSAARGNGRETPGRRDRTRARRTARRRRAHRRRTGPLLRPQPRSRRPGPRPARRSAPRVTRQPGPRPRRGRRSSALTPTLPPSSAPLRRLATTPPVNSRSCAPTLTGPAKKPLASSARPAPMPNANARNCGPCWTPGPGHWQRPVTTCGPALSAPKPTWTRPAPNSHAYGRTAEATKGKQAPPGRGGGAARLRRAKPGRTTQVRHSAIRDGKDPGRFLAGVLSHTPRAWNPYRRKPGGRERVGNPPHGPQVEATASVPFS